MLIQLTQNYILVKSVWETTEEVRTVCYCYANTITNSNT